MSVNILKDRTDIYAARSILKQRKLDYLTSSIHNFLVRVGIPQKARVGDLLKSWDVLKTVRFIEENIPKNSNILDIGAYGSEILPILINLGYESLFGIDINPRLRWMPYAKQIDYRVENYFRSSLNDLSLDAITAISVIEHGFSPKRLLEELTRLLRPGGYFIASVDYWINKIETSNIKPFNMDWIIFSKKDLAAFIQDAEYYGLYVLGDINFQTIKPVVRWKNRNYTFAWMAFQKTPSH